MNSGRFPLVLLIASTLAGCADRLVLYPPMMATAPSNATARSVPFRGGELQIWTERANPSREPAVFVLEFGGNATRAEWVVDPTAKRWRDVNAEAWVLNYPGYGGSTGPARLDAIAASALAAYDALREVAGDRPIFVVGRSLGTTAALHVAAHRPVAGIVLHSATPLATVIRDNFGWWNFGLLSGMVADKVPANLDSVVNARNCRAPAFFLLTTRDMLVRPGQQRAVIDAYAGPKEILALPSADHGSDLAPAEEQRVRDAIRSWLNANGTRVSAGAF